MSSLFVTADSIAFIELISDFYMKVKSHVIEYKLYVNSQVKTKASKTYFAHGRLLALGAYRVTYSLSSAVG